MLNLQREPLRSPERGEGGRFMRKILWMLAVLVPSFAYGEQMNFVTTLSSPYGVFHSLDVTDVSTPTVVGKVNFGAKQQTPRGTIYIYGKESPYFEDIEITRGSTLQGNKEESGDTEGVKEFRSHNIANFVPGIIKGKNLLVDRIYDTNSTALNAQNARVLGTGDLIEKLDKIHLSVNGTLYNHKLRIFGLHADNLCFVKASSTKVGENHVWTYAGGSKIRHGKDNDHPNGDLNSAAPNPRNAYNFKWTNKYQLQYFAKERLYACPGVAAGGEGRCSIRTPVKVYYDDWKGYEKFRVPYCPLINTENGLRNHGCGYPENIYLLAGHECEGAVFPGEECSWL